MSKALKKISWIGITLFSFFVGVSVVFAQSSGNLTNPLCPSGSQNCSNSSFVGVMQSIFSFLFTDVAVPLCAIMVLVGAFQMMTAGGDPEKFSNGRKTL